MIMKGYSTLLRATELEPHHQMQFGVLSKPHLFFFFFFFGGVLPVYKEIQIAYSLLHQQGSNIVKYCLS